MPLSWVRVKFNDLRAQVLDELANELEIEVSEDLVEALIAARGRPVPPPPHQIARWWKGIRASLDRTPPPAY